MQKNLSFDAAYFLLMALLSFSAILLDNDYLSQAAVLSMFQYLVVFGLVIAAMHIVAFLLMAKGAAGCGLAPKKIAAGLSGAILIYSLLVFPVLIAFAAAFAGFYSLMGSAAREAAFSIEGLFFLLTALYAIISGAEKSSKGLFSKSKAGTFFTTPGMIGEKILNPLVVAGVPGAFAIIPISIAVLPLFLDKVGVFMYVIWIYSIWLLEAAPIFFNIKTLGGVKSAILATLAFFSGFAIMGFVSGSANREVALVFGIGATYLFLAWLRIYKDHILRLQPTEIADDDRFHSSAQEIKLDKFDAWKDSPLPQGRQGIGNATPDERIDFANGGKRFSAPKNEKAG